MTHNPYTLHTFSDRALWQMAIQHSSLQAGIQFDRLEFVGDRLVNLATAESLFTLWPHASAGVMAQTIAQLSAQAHLAALADRIGLTQHIQASKMPVGAAEKSDTLEAYVAAVAMDAGVETALAMVRAWMHLAIAELKEAPQDPKNTLQEWAQARSLALPKYTVVHQQGPDHAPSFRVRVEVGSFTTEADGASKKQAERQAAIQLLAELKS